MATTIGHINVKVIPNLLPQVATPLTDFLNDTRVSYHRSYYPAGELDTAPVVITAKRITQAEYDALASGDADYVQAVSVYAPAAE